MIGEENKFAFMMLTFLYVFVLTAGILVHQKRMDKMQEECQKAGFTWLYTYDTCLTGNVPVKYDRGVLSILEKN